MDYYSFTDPGGIEGWVGVVRWPIEDSTTHKVMGGHLSTIDRAQGRIVRRPKTDVLTTELYTANSEK